MIGEPEQPVEQQAQVQSGLRTLFSMSAALFLAALSISIYASQLPNIIKLWGLSNTDAGWIGGAYFAGYVVAVPILTSLTDRLDARLVFAAGSGLLALGCLGFALLAVDAWTAAAAHAVMGFGFAGAYMPGLKGMSDHLPATQLSRAAGVYSGSFILATALSFPLGAWVGHIFAWWAPFVVCSASALMAPIFVFAGLPSPGPRASSPPSSRWLLDFRPVFANHKAIAYSWCYGLHCWELFAVRTWMVAFLSFSLNRDGAGMSALAEWPVFAPANIAAVAMILGFFANLLGNELAIRIGRLHAISRVMVLSAAVCLAVPQLGEMSYWLAAIACMAHGMTLLGESTACTAGALGNAPKDLRGATMALHSTIGFTGGFLGPLVFGLLLDVGGGQSQIGWTIAYAHLAVVILLGPIVLRYLGAGTIAGDRA